jgi:hypothetical protein
MALTSGVGSGPELWVTSGHPSQTDFTEMFVGEILSDLGAGTQVIISNGFLTDDGVVCYYDNSSDQSSVVWFRDLGGGGFEQGIFGTRIPLNTLVCVVLRSSSTNVNGSWLDLTDPSASWVTASTTNPISGQGGNNTMSLTSNANGANTKCQIFRMWEGQLTDNECKTEAYSLRAVRRLGLKFDIAMDDGDVTSTWPDMSGAGNTASQQGGNAPSDSANYPQIFDVVHAWNATGFVIAAGADADEALTGSASTSASGTAVPNIAVPL